MYFLPVSDRDQWIVNTLLEIQTKLDNLTRIVQSVVNDKVPAVSLPAELNLPVDTIDDLKTVEELLEGDKTIADKLVSELYTSRLCKV